MNQYGFPMQKGDHKAIEGILSERIARRFELSRTLFGQNQSIRNQKVLTLSELKLLTK